MTTNPTATNFLLYTSKTLLCHHHCSLINCLYPQSCPIKIFFKVWRCRLYCCDVETSILANNVSVSKNVILKTRVQNQSSVVRKFSTRLQYKWGFCCIFSKFLASFCCFFSKFLASFCCIFSIFLASFYCIFSKFLASFCCIFSKFLAIFCFLLLILLRNRSLIRLKVWQKGWASSKSTRFMLRQSCSSLQKLASTGHRFPFQI